MLMGREVPDASPAPEGFEPVVRPLLVGDPPLVACSFSKSLPPLNQRRRRVLEDVEGAIL